MLSRPARRQGLPALRVGLALSLTVVPAAAQLGPDDPIRPPEPLPSAQVPLAKAPSPSHRVGPRPKTPRPQLPEVVRLSTPSERARLVIAGRPTAEQGGKGAPDEQLEQLRAAESVLFPDHLQGITPGWSFELPAAAVGAPQDLGLPLRAEAPARTELSAEDSAWLHSLTLPDLPVRLDRRVVTYLKFYRDSPRGRTIATIWAQKSGRYIAAMKAALRRARLPSDLVWLSMIESGHDPTIRSPAGAVGLWQFMPESGRMYGLTVDHWVDERRDPARSTQAAIRFLSDLHQRFGNWELAMGAYNMGYAGMSRTIAKYSTNDYWALSRLESALPWETTLYVPKVFALAIVMNNREAFGLGRVKAEPAVSFDTILVEPETMMAAVARAAGVLEAEIVGLNPGYVAGRVPALPEGARARRFPVAVPLGTGARAQAQLAKGEAASLAVVQVRHGDRLSTLASSYGVSAELFAVENGLEVGTALPAGTVLLLPAGAKLRAPPRQMEPVVVSRIARPSPREKVVFYDVAAGDDLEELAEAFGVVTADLARWNALDVEARLTEGMTFQVVVPQDRDLSRVRHFQLGADETHRLLVTGSPEFHEHFEGMKGKRRVTVVAQVGDTLEGIGRRHGMTVGSMERVNGRSRKTTLLAGERLIVYTERAAASATSADEVSPLPALEVPRPELLPSSAKAAL